MSGDSLLAYMKSKLETVRRQVGDAAIDFSLSDETVLELRENARRLRDEVTELERKAKKGLFRFLGF